MNDVKIEWLYFISPVLMANKNLDIQVSALAIAETILMGGVAISAILFFNGLGALTIGSILALILPTKTPRSVAFGLELFGKWGQGANLDKISRFPSLLACHGACVKGVPANKHCVEVEGISAHFKVTYKLLSHQ